MKQFSFIFRSNFLLRNNFFIAGTIETTSSIGSLMWTVLYVDRFVGSVLSPKYGILTATVLLRVTPMTLNNAQQNTMEGWAFGCFS